MAITLSNSSIAENTANGTVIGILTGGTPDYTLTDDAGGAFTIVQNGSDWELRVADSVLLDYEGVSLHSLSIEVTDSAGTPLVGTFSVAITDVADETATGGAGNDEMYGGDGNDTISGGDGHDTISGGDGNNVLSGNAGNDSLTGGAGNDSLDGGTGNDTMTGNGGDDTYVVDSANDIVNASAGGGTDTLVLMDASFTSASNLYSVAGGIETIVIDDGAGPAYVEANGGANTIYDSIESNFIDAQGGADTIIGSDGDDTYVVWDSNAVVTEDNGLVGGTDEVQSYVDYTISDVDVENLTLIGTSASSGTGNASDNVITGNNKNNRIDGAGGDDTLIGGGGNDTYVLYAGDPDPDTITELAGGGVDTVEIDDDFNLTGYDNVENLINTDTLNGHVLVGNALNNSITGSDGDDTIDGRAGKDTMAGGLGDDTYVVDQATEVIQEAEHLTGGEDTVIAQVSFDLSLLGAEVENIFLDTGLATADINATGNDYDNFILGNEGANKLDGKAGTDTMFGGDGDDTYVVRDVATVVGEFKDDGLGGFTTTSSGTDTVQSYVTYSIAADANIENITLMGTDDIDATGNTGNNVLTGNQGANVLNGGTGNDTMDGGAGDDTYYVDSANDVVSEGSAAGGYDVVISAASLTIGNNIDELQLVGALALDGTGNNGANLIVGNAEDNTLDGQGGADTMWGGDGDDTYVVDNAGDVALDVGTDGTTPAAGNDWVSTETQDIDLSDSARFSGIENVDLGSGSLNIDATGTTAANVLLGNDGNNRLDAGTGADTLAGGLGDDVYVLDGTDDTVTEAADAGTDTIEVNATYSIAAMSNIENLTLTGTADIDATGNDLDNKITGNSGANLIDGGAGADRMEGGAGDDTYVVDDNNDRVVEDVNGGFDTVMASSTFSLGVEVEGLILTGSDDINGSGNASDNRIEGNDGANVINGGAGVDTMLGNAGDDTFWVGGENDVVNGGDDIDTVKTGAKSIDLSNALLYSNVENATVVGSGAHNLTGTVGNNVLTGGGGANVLDGNGGADTMYGGAGNDTYIVDSADDEVAEAGNGVVAGGTDTVVWTGDAGASFTSYTMTDKIDNLTMLGDALDATGNAEANTIVGNVLANTIDGGVGADTMQGGAGNDTYYVDNSKDSIVENAAEGADVAISTARSWTMSDEVETAIIADGGTRRDVFGNASANVITGGDQANWIKGGGGADTLSGGAGNDTFVIDALDAVDGGDGTDWVYADTVDVDLSSFTDVENINLRDVSKTVWNDLAATGNALDNRILGNSGDNAIDGGAGDDWMQGGKGDDTYQVDSKSDRVIEWSNQGTDTVEATAAAGFTAYTLTGNVENLTLLTGMITGKGNGLNNVITGNAEDNVINGAAGVDTMIGGDGDDTYYINKTTETITEAATVGSGTDTVRTYVSNYTLGANLENLELMGLIKNGTGNSLANTITGNNAANTIDGGTNADTMIGGRGNDTYVVDNASDVVTELQGQGYDRVQSSVTYTLGDNIEVLELTGSSNIDGTGNGLSNQLLGNSGANVLDGGGNNDILNGGAGADTLTGGFGKDVFILANSGSIDTITDFTVVDDTIKLSKGAFSALGSTGTLAAGAFVIGSAALDANDRVIYDSSNGKLYYDADGNGAGVKEEIADLTAGLALTNADFIIIA